MLNKKLIIGFIVALIALIVVGYVALNFVPTNEVLDLNLTDNAENLTDNITENLTVNATDVNASADDNQTVNDTNASSDGIDPGDVLKKQTFVVSENETGQNQGMEPGTYVMYYTENDGPIKIEKIA